MAKKAELLDQAKTAGLEVTEKNTIAELEAALEAHSTQTSTEKGEPEIKAVAQEVNEESGTQTFAKAGKRSAKSVAEAKEKAAKEERKADTDSAETKKNPVPKTRSRLERRGKKYQEAQKKIDTSKTYNLEQALQLACETSTARFDGTVELHVRLNVDPKHADQNIRASLVLPEGTGKTARVAVFAEDDDAKKALAAGADIAANEEFLQQLEKEVINFDVLIATPNMMAKLSKYARLLGPKGLMPNPKSGTVTNDVVKAVKESKGGKVEYRVDETGIIHIGIGKVSFGTQKLLNNARVVIESIQSNKPASVKGNYVVNSFTTSTMGPSIPFEI